MLVLFKPLSEGTVVSKLSEVFSTIVVQSMIGGLKRGTCVGEQNPYPDIALEKCREK